MSGSLNVRSVTVDSFQVDQSFKCVGTTALQTRTHQARGMAPKWPGGCSYPCFHLFFSHSEPSDLKDNFQ